MEKNHKIFLEGDDCEDIQSLIDNLIPKKPVANLTLPDPALIDYYRDYNNRVIWCLEGISTECYDWAGMIINWNRDDKGLDPKDRKPIYIYLSNYGGDSNVANLLIEVIKLSKTPVYTVAMAMCASAASMIYLAGHKRYALPSAIFLFHKGGCKNMGGNFAEMDAFMDMYKKEIKEMSEYYKKNTTFDPDFIDNKLDRGDWYVYLEDAVENGVVDEIIEDIDTIL